MSEKHFKFYNNTPIKLILIIIHLIIPYQHVNSAQEPENIYSLLDSLEVRRIELQDSLNFVTNVIDSLKQAQLLIEINGSYNASITAIISKSTDVRLQPSLLIEVVDKLSKGDTVILLDYDGRFFKIAYEGKAGYIYLDTSIKKSKIVESYMDANLLRRQIEREQKQKEALLYDKQRKDEKSKRRKESKAETLAALALLDSLKTINNNYQKHPMWISSETANVRVKPTTKSDIIMSLNLSKQVYLQEQKGNWCRVKILNQPNKNLRRLRNLQELEDNYAEGWIHHSLLSDRYIFYDDIKRIEFIKDNPRIADIYKKAIRSGVILIGMTKDMVIASWGRPKDINSTITSYGVHEQWIYGSHKYVYLEDGIVTAIQD